MVDVEHTLTEVLKMPLEWSEERPPTKDVSHYDHVVAKTPLGDITLEWKSWKEWDSPCGTMPWGEFVIANDLADAKEAVQAAWDKMIPTLLPLCSKGNVLTDNAGERQQG